MAVFDESRKLEKEDLKEVSGGSWTLETLTAEEIDEYNAIRDYFYETYKVHGDLEPCNAEAQDFIDRMDAKYGPSGWKIRYLF